MLALPAINTGVFVYQSFIIESKKWDDYVIAQSFMFYAIFSVITLFIAGPIIDKLTSRKILPLMNIPSLFAMLILFYFDHYMSSYFLLGLMGISNGLANVLGSSTWAEIYGVYHLGSIKALTGSLMVFSTALATAIFGILIDLRYTIENIAILCSIYIVASIAIVFVFQNAYKPVLLKK